MKFPVKEDYILGFIILVKSLLKTTLMSILFPCILIIFGISLNVLPRAEVYSIYVFKSPARGINFTLIK